MATMASKKPKNDRHTKKQMQMRIHPAMRAQLELLAERNASTLTAEITIAIRRHLETEGLWPPPTPQPKKQP